MAFIAIVGVTIAIYQGFFYEKRGNISITIDPPARVFDLHQPIGGLEVSYAGEDLRLSKKTLWILSAAIKNIGNAAIKRGDYDDQAPLGLQIDGGQLVDVPSIRTNISYLRQHFKISTGNQKIFFSPVILEPEDSVYVNFLILGSESTKPTISAFGKIAGARSVTLINAESGESTASWAQRVLGADAYWIQPVRISIYGLCGLLSIGILLALITAIISFFRNIEKKRKVTSRRTKIEAYRKGEDLSKELRLLTGLYIFYGDWALQTMKKVVTTLEHRAEYHDRLTGVMGEDELKTNLPLLTPLGYGGGNLVKELEEIKVLKFDVTRPMIQDNLKLELTRLSKYLEIDLDDASMPPPLNEMALMHDRLIG